MDIQLKYHTLSSNGFTLLEVMIALVVLSIGILSLGGMQITAIRGNSSANSITDAANETRDQIETLFGKKFSDTAFDVNAGTPHTAGNRSWIVTDWSNDGIDNDMDTVIDEPDERGVKSIQLTIQNPNSGKNSTIFFLKTEIF